MTILEILRDEELSSQKKLDSIQDIVNTIRQKYGNTDAEITSPEVTTATGLQPMAMLTAEDKLALVNRVVDAIRTDSYEDAQNAEGVVLDRRVEEYVATNAILNNLDATLDSAYL